MTLVCNHFPRKLIKHLKKRRNLEIEKHGKGIYYIKGELFPAQLIVTKRLSKEDNLWLRSLTNDLTQAEAEKLVHAYDGHENDTLYTSMMDVIVRANEEGFREAKRMCEALKELWKDEFEEMKQQGFSQGKEIGKEIGKQEFLFKIISRMALRGRTVAQIVDELEESEEVILPLYNKALEKQNC